MTIETLIVPLSSLDLTCPKCDGKTMYRRTGSPPYEEEGIFCWECKENIEDMIKRSFPMFFRIKANKIKDFAVQYSKNIKNLYSSQRR